MTTANMEVDSANTNDDDMTVVTGSDSVRPPAQRSWQTLTIKISFKSKDAIPVTTMANNTMTLLDSMKQSFQQDIKIFDNHDKEVRDYTAQEPSKFTQLYDIEVVKGRRKRKRKHFSFIVFCIQTKHALSDIRRHSNGAHNAQRLGAKIQFHAWPEGIKDVATAGFISGPIPRYTMPSAIQDQLLKILTTDHASGDKPEQIPDFRCVMAPISAVNSKTNRRYSCQAYTIQVQRKDYSALTRLLRKSFNRETQGIQFFEFYLRREDPDSVCKAVVRQCARESNHMVIAVQGILPSLPLSGLKHRLCQEFPAIKDILPTPKTNARNTSGKVLGRYNLLCESSNFSSLVHDLQARFSHVYETKVLSKAPTSSTADTMVDPAIVSNFRQPSDDESSGLTSRKSYLSSLQESFADFSIDDVDVPFEIVTQPPPNQPKKSYATAASPGTKPPANVTSDKQEILQLREELKSAFTKIAQLTALVEKLTVDQSVPSTQSTPPSAILSQDKVQKMINDTIHVAQSSVREELEGFRTEIRQFECSSASAAGANSPFRKMPRGEAGRGRGLGRGSGS